MQRAATAARRSPDARAVWDPHVKRRLNYQRVQKHYDALAATGPTPMLKEPWNVSLDNRQPKSMNMKHLKVRAKKAQLEAERFAEVEMENRNLLRKMTHIMNNDPLTRRSEAGGLVSTPFLFRSVLQAKPGLRCDVGHYPQTASRNLAPRKSLNLDARRKEQRRIERENSRMLERIVTQKPFYSAKRWAKERRMDEYYLSNVRSREVKDITRNFSRNVPPSSGAYEQYIASRARPHSAPAFGRSSAGRP